MQYIGLVVVLVLVTGLSADDRRLPLRYRSHGKENAGSVSMRSAVSATRSLLRQIRDTLQRPDSALLTVADTVITADTAPDSTVFLQDAATDTLSAIPDSVKARRDSLKARQDSIARADSLSAVQKDSLDLLGKS